MEEGSFRFWLACSQSDLQVPLCCWAVPSLVLESTSLGFQCKSKTSRSSGLRCQIGIAQAFSLVHWLSRSFAFLLEDNKLLGYIDHHLQATLWSEVFPQCWKHILLLFIVLEKSIVGYTFCVVWDVGFPGCSSTRKNIVILPIQS